MNASDTIRRRSRDAKGATLVFVAVMLVLLLGFVALAVDLGYGFVATNELQNVADAAALAGARQLGVIYEGLTMPQQQSYVADPGAIRAPAVAVAAMNTAATVPITIPAAEVEIGTWDPARTPPFVPTLNQPDAVRTTARRDSTANGPISTFFAGVLGIQSMDRSATATAALTGSTTIGPGDLIPVGLSKEWFDANPTFCGQPIKFSPSNAPAGCAGWNVYDHWPASESYLRKDILEDWLAGSFTPPGASTGDGFSFTGGTLGNQAFTAFLNLFNYMKVHDDDGDPTTWSAYVVVYGNGGCSNPNNVIPIVGFAAAKITAVLPPPDKIIDAQVLCDLVEPGRGGGANYGVKGSIPGLVK